MSLVVSPAKSQTKLCRACLQVAETFVFVLFENVSADLYYFCTAIEIVQNDDYPKSICNYCYELLIKCSEFKNTCIKSQNSLLKLRNQWNCGNSISTDDNKTEEIDPFIIVKTEVVYNSEKQSGIIKNPEKVCNNSADKKDLTPFNNTFEFENDSFSLESALHDDQRNKKLKRKTKKQSQTKPKKSKKEVKKRQYIFTCDLCNKKFLYLERLEAHKLEHEGKPVSLQCRSCDKRFATWSGLTRHGAACGAGSGAGGGVTCGACHKTFKNQRTLKAHQATHGERRLRICQLCGKRLTTPYNLKLHLETHQTERARPYACSQCGGRFYTRATLGTHTARRHSPRRFVCHACSRAFTDKYNLTKHLAAHEGRRPHACVTCRKTFASPRSLAEHARTHSGERPFHCAYCSKRFPSKKRLDEHHRIHTGDRPYVCADCGHSFTQRGTLKRHMKVHNRQTV